MIIGAVTLPYTLKPGCACLLNIALVPSQAAIFFASSGLDLYRSSGTTFVPVC